jgi:hypothetical protein
MTRALFVALLAVTIPLGAADKPATKPAGKPGLVWTFTPDPALPDVLILGDSISIGYTPLVRQLL